MDFEDVMGLYYFESEPLFKAMQILEESRDDIVLILNKILFDHIQDMRQIAVGAGDWDEDNIYWLPNKEFVRYFQELGVNPKGITTFEEHPHHKIQELNWDMVEDDVYTNRLAEKIFGLKQFTDDEKTLQDLSDDCRIIFGKYPYHFNTLRDVYMEACKWWRLMGVKRSKVSKARPKDGTIKWEQLEKALNK